MGQTSAGATFIDVVQTNGEGDALLNYDIDWKGNGDFIVTPGLGSASAYGKFWMFPFPMPIPAPGTVFFGTAYRAAFFSSGGAISFDSVGDTKGLAKDTSYWIVGELGVVAARSSNGPIFAGPVVLSKADFLNTMELFIDPSADSPGAFMTSNSRHDYATPVPEPSTGLLVLCASLAVGIRKRRKG
jgi:hypothetical protein